MGIEWQLHQSSSLSVDWQAIDRKISLHKQRTNSSVKEMANLSSQSDAKLRVFDAPFEDKVVAIVNSSSSDPPQQSRDEELESTFKKVAWLNYGEDRRSRQENLQKFKERCHKIILSSNICCRSSLGCQIGK